MCKILDFRPPASKTSAEATVEVFDVKQAIDLIVLDFLHLALPKWVKHEWPFKQLELMTNQLRFSMEEAAPEIITRKEVDWMIESLRPSWEILIRDIDASLFW